MAQDEEADGKNSLIGEFLVAFVRAPDPLKEAILIQSLKIMLPYQANLVAPYPMLSHMLLLLQKQGILPGGNTSGSGEGFGGTGTGGGGGSSHTH